MALDLTKPFLLAGDLYIGEINANGTRGTLLGDKLEVEKLSLTPSAETVEQKSKGIATYGQVRSSIILPGDTVLEISPMDLPAEIAAMYFLGSSASLSQAAGTVTDEPVTGVLDRWVDLAHRQIGAGPVATVAAGGAALVLGTDFEIEYVSGMYKALTAAAAVPVLLDYSHAAIAGQRVTVGGNTNVNRWLRLVGKNLHDGEMVLLECWRVKLRPSGNADLMANQHVVIGLTGKLEQSRDPADNSETGVLTYLGA